MKGLQLNVTVSNMCFKCDPDLRNMPGKREADTTPALHTHTPPTTRIPNHLTLCLLGSEQSKAQRDERTFESTYSYANGNCPHTHTFVRGLGETKPMNLKWGHSS